MSAHKTSVYRNIRNDLAEKMKSGRIAPGEKLLPERAFMEEYGVERTTIRRALALLEADGLIIKKPGLGSFAASEREIFDAKAEKSAMLKPVRKQKLAKRKNLPAQFSVIADYASASKVTCSKLHELEHERIAYIGCMQEPFEAFVGQALGENFYEAPFFVCCETLYDIENAFFTMFRSARTTPTAVVCGNEQEAELVIRAAKRYGLSIPDSLSVAVLEKNKDAQIDGCVFETLDACKQWIALLDGAADSLVPAGTFGVQPLWQAAGTVAAASKRSSGSRGMSDYLL